MSDIWLNMQLAFKHVLDLNAYDHILFFILLILMYDASHWKRIFLLVTIFTLGHTTSLFLAAYGVISVNKNLAEFLILLTIFATGVFNIITSNKSLKNSKINILYGVTLFFGLIHGLGFYNYFKINSGFGSKALQILGFSFGVEIAQLIIVIVVLVLSFIVQTVFRFSKKDWILAISSIVTGMVIQMMIQTKIW